jgi:hypothetical protein
LARLDRLFGRGRRNEQGQVLVIFAVGAVAFLGMLALIVDGGNLYFERRHAQATADAAALVAAQDTQGILPSVSLRTGDAVRDARVYTIKNGYSTDPGANNGMWHNDVRVDVPPSSGPYAGDAGCVEVRIRRSVPAFFAGIFGASPEVEARAVARGKQVGMQVATLSLDDGAASTVNAGSGTTTVIGGTYSRGVTKGQTGSLSVQGRSYARGGFQGTAINPTEGFVGAPYSGPPPDMFDPKWTAPVAISSPGVSWHSNGIVEKATKDVNGWVHITPGTYDYISVASGDKVIFAPGVYKLTQTQGLTNNGTIHGTGVCFVMNAKADFSSQAQGQVYLTSSPAYNNILIWSADCMNDAVKVAGGADVTFWGTIYAPCGTVRLSGNSAGLVHGQVVAKDIKFEGTSGTSVVYDSMMAAEIPGPVLVE